MTWCAHGLHVNYCFALFHTNITDQLCGEIVAQSSKFAKFSQNWFPSLLVVQTIQTQFTRNKWIHLIFIFQRRVAESFEVHRKLYSEHLSIMDPQLKDQLGAIRISPKWKPYLSLLAQSRMLWNMSNFFQKSSTPTTINDHFVYTELLSACRTIFSFKRFDLS